MEPPLMRTHVTNPLSGHQYGDVTTSRADGGPAGGQGGTPWASAPHRVRSAGVKGATTLWGTPVSWVGPPMDSPLDQGLILSMINEARTGAINDMYFSWWIAGAYGRGWSNSGNRVTTVPACNRRIASSVSEITLKSRVISSAFGSEYIAAYRQS